ncbi:hypothetical protein L596_009515 [Steinernema carpocapsae]|uniref:Uncharacterized protein n=1 Tax=Steinernema carpocapsae TaxID=34508 RepID=A0A4U5PGC8_STECR|nr:hypothetical protein L596_009515 [Steinernema carpocapsae]
MYFSLKSTTFPWTLEAFQAEGLETNIRLQTGTNSATKMSEIEFKALLKLIRGIRPLSHLKIPYAVIRNQSFPSQT